MGNGLVKKVLQGVGSIMIAAGVVAGFALPAPADAAPGPGSPLPSADPFYAWDGSLRGVAPGTVLRTRPMTFRTPDQPTPITGTQVLYRTTDQFGEARATVATVLRPLVPGPPRLVSYHMAYDALGAQCDPSYTLSGGYTNGTATTEQGVIAGYLAAGYTDVVPDYEGEDLQWTIGRQSGYAALDGVRAAQSFLRLPTSTPVGLVGYSGGSIPTQWVRRSPRDTHPNSTSSAPQPADCRSISPTIFPTSTAVPSGPASSRHWWSPINAPTDSTPRSSSRRSARG